MDEQEYQNQIAALETERDQLKQELTTKDEKIADAEQSQAKVTELNEQITGLTQMNDQLKEQAGEKDGEIAKLNEQVQKLTVDRDELQAKETDLQKRVASEVARMGYSAPNTFQKPEQDKPMTWTEKVQAAKQQ